MKKLAEKYSGVVEKALQSYLTEENDMTELNERELKAFCRDAVEKIAGFRS